MERKDELPEAVLEELRWLDTEDKILLLSIGKRPSSNTRIVKTALLLSEILGNKLDAVPYKYGLFSETIFEKIHDERLRIFIKKHNGKSELTKEGQQAYDLLLGKLKAKNREDAIQLLEALQKLSEEDV